MKIHSIFMGRIVRKYCIILGEGDSWYMPRIIEESKTIERVKICECDLSVRLKEKEEIFLHEQQVYATIQKVSEGTDGNIYYDVSYVVETINDIEETRQELKEKLSQCMVDYQEKRKLVDESNKKEKEEKAEVELEINTILKETSDWQKANTDKIKGIIILDIPKDKNGQVVSLFLFNNILLNLLKRVPKEYIIIPSMGNVTYINSTNKENISDLINANIADIMNNQG